MSEENNQPVTLDLRKIYVSDLSIEVPHTPEIFNENLNPEITLGVNHDIKALAEEDYFAVKVRLTVTAKNQGDEKTIYLIEVAQNGIFEIKGLTQEQLSHALNVYCTTTLFPYAREVISSAITRAGFPSLYIQPINFEVIYQQNLQQAAMQEQGAQSGEA